ncbi:hypothetical protein CAI21_12190 [Alkalilimnicola ehrlichii]|uniref:NolW-like domain-containing protein n=1 Tax=Alkalilimnicola ehrlichii TaxID=351052 RepID=A0A3E0WZT1_9GAMM|nr:hypothetical protein [Alkalilimnicola ehrlichii]RFA28337.1 hypothetical protein CAI21_12190 [Alkalilimnicola ehrlichii]RFA38597.1 hypothetical protein CAL65_04465 [Alkalilimnicola ehrlichii]
MLPQPYRYLAFIALLLSAPAIASNELELIELTYQDAEEIIPLLQPHAAGGVTLSGQGSTLILRGSQHDIDGLRTIISQLDRAPQAIRVSVRSDRSMTQQNAGGGVQSSERSVRVYGTRRADDGSGTQTVRGVAGRPLHIARSIALPVTEFDIGQDQDGIQYSQRQTYIHAANGFYARARLQGENVTIDLMVDTGEFPDRQFQRPHQRQQLVSQVSGRVGEWILVGETMQQERQSDDSMVYRSRRRGLEDNQIWLRVERL